MYIIAYDLGTGGVKASLYDSGLHTAAKSFIEYKTYYPQPNMHEQKPSDWWDGVVKSTRILLNSSGINASDIRCVSLSGHSDATIPLDLHGKELLERIPIWSDARAGAEAVEFFERIPEKDWYMSTGNGFPAALYVIFKLMWFKKHEPAVFNNIHKVLGSKDYINYRLTGKLYTDHSYASGTGAYSLSGKRFIPEYLEAAGLKKDVFPEIVPSHTIIGNITEEASRLTGLSAETVVACGGVDNSCMALGAVGAVTGKTYTSLGSSSWIAVNSGSPVLDYARRPYTFAHIEEGLFTSAFSIFSGGSSLKWVRDILCADIKDLPGAYDEMARIASLSPPGSNGVFFNPSLAGGTSQDKSVNISGAFTGLHLGNDRADIIRAAFEGIAMNLRMSLDLLMLYADVSNDILFTGGGSKSPFWMQLFADIFDTNIIKTNVDQDTASLGAAAIGARGLGLWKDYSFLDALQSITDKKLPTRENVELYEKLYSDFVYVNEQLAEMGDHLASR